MMDLSYDQFLQEMRRSGVTLRVWKGNLQYKSSALKDRDDLKILLVKNRDRVISDLTGGATIIGATIPTRVDDSADASEARATIPKSADPGATIPDPVSGLPHPSAGATILDSSAGSIPYKSRPAEPCSDSGRAALSRWFMDVGRHLVPEEPFDLHPGVRVVDPAKFAQAIVADVARGIEGPRARTGALLSDLRRLHRLFGQASTEGYRDTTANA